MQRDDVQAAVDALAAKTTSSVLIEDAAQLPLWWSTIGEVDRVREQTILYRNVDSETAHVVDVHNLKITTQLTRVQENPELGMWQRWCKPLRNAEDLYGYLWVIDRSNLFSDVEFEAIEDCAVIATNYLVRQNSKTLSDIEKQNQLAEVLFNSRTPDSRDSFLTGADLKPSTMLGVHHPPRGRGWKLSPSFSLHISNSSPENFVSGEPLAASELFTLIARAEMTVLASSAGAKLESLSWNSLGAWKLLTDRISDFCVEDICPGIGPLLDNENTDLLTTAEVVLMNGSDIQKSAAELFVHRTTLYYRLDRIQALCGIDLRTSSRRTDLLLAIRLHALQQISHSRPTDV